MRLFIAIHFYGAAKTRLLTLQRELRSRSARGNFSLPENLHLTLVFLGECDAQQTAAVKQVLDTARFEPFDLTIGGLAQFTGQTAGIFYVNVQHSPELLTLQRNLSDHLISHGFRLDRRQYKPHITVGREVILREPISTSIFKPVTETVNGIDLMKSERQGGKLVYTKLYEKKSAVLFNG